MTTVAQITDALQGYDPQSVKVDDVVHIAKSLVKPLGNLPQDIEVLNLHTAAYRVLALDVVSLTNVPAVDNSAMDGYAFFLHAGQVSQDLALTVSGLRLAGQPITGDEPTLQAGHCLHIMTGAPMPDGSNTVVPSELV